MLPFAGHNHACPVAARMNQSASCIFTSFFRSYASLRSYKGVSPERKTFPYNSGKVGRAEGLYALVSGWWTYQQS